jgi:hypothetical protein
MDWDSAVPFIFLSIEACGKDKTMLALFSVGYLLLLIAMISPQL